MAISTTDARVTALGNDAATEFPFAFALADASHIVVTLATATGTTMLVQGTDYALALSPGAGGTVTLLGGPAPEGAVLTIRRVVPLTQETDLRNQGAFYAEVIEAALDLATMGLQQLDETAARALQFAPEDISGASVLVPTPEATRVLAWNEAGDGLANGPTTGAIAAAAANAAGALEARIAAEAARDLAEGHATIATGQSDTAIAAAATATTQAGLATDAQTAAEAARALAVDANDAAQAARGLAEDARDAAQASAGTASTAAGTATSQAGLASDARDGAETARDQAVDARQAAEQARDAAQSAAADGTVKVSAADTTADTLDAKLILGDGLVASILDPGAAEAIGIELDLAADPGLEFDAGGLRARIKGGGGLTRDGDGLSVSLGSAASQAAPGNHGHAGFTGDAGSGGASGFVPAPAAGDAAAGKVLGAGGGWIAAPAGKVLGHGHAETRTAASISAVVPNDDTKPQSSEGTEVLTLTYNRRSATSHLLVTATVTGCNNTDAAWNYANLFQDANADSLHGIAHATRGAGAPVSMAFSVQIASGSAGDTTFKLRLGVSSGTYTVNGYNGARIWGGAMGTTLTVIEVEP